MAAKRASSSGTAGLREDWREERGREKRAREREIFFPNKARSEAELEKKKKNLLLLPPFSAFLRFYPNSQDTRAFGSKPTGFLRAAHSLTRLNELSKLRNPESEVESVACNYGRGRRGECKR